MIICNNCGSAGSIDEVKARHPTALSCCPERDTRVTVINVRGTGGSGKSTLVKNIMALYPDKVEGFIPGRKQPILTNLSGNGRRTLVVPGHYNTACGGCDTVKTVDQVYEIVQDAAARGCDVLYEGIMVMDDTKRADKLARDPNVVMFIIGLTTPAEDCVKAIQDRRDARGETKPLNPKNTVDRAKRCEAGLDKLKGMKKFNGVGATVERWSREAAFSRVKRLLDLEQSFA